jgi:hypothetical protein
MMFRTKNSCSTRSSQLKIRTGLQAGSLSGCMAYCGQEYNRCLSDGTPSDTCNDRLPVCQNACTVCGRY